MLLARKRGPDSMETDGQLAPPAVHEVLATSGTPLPSQERAFFEPGLVTTSVASVSVPISPRRRRRSRWLPKHSPLAAHRLWPPSLCDGRNGGQATNRARTHPRGAAGPARSIRWRRAARLRSRQRRRTRRRSSRSWSGAPRPAAMAVQRQLEQPNMGPPAQQLPLPRSAAWYSRSGDSSGNVSTCQRSGPRRRFRSIRATSPMRSTRHSRRIDRRAVLPQDRGPEAGSSSDRGSRQAGRGAVPAPSGALQVFTSAAIPAGSSSFAHARPTARDSVDR